MNDIVEQDQQGGNQIGQPRQILPSSAQVEIEMHRAVAEVQGQIAVALKFPRSVAAATAELIESCRSFAFAEKAFYAVTNRGSGPSIRFAEEAARCYKNFQFGHKELSRSSDRSEVEVYAWDVQNNNYSRRQITVMHVIDTRDGPRKLRDQVDIDNRIANIAGRQMRGRILALLPKAMIAEAIIVAKQTLEKGPGNLTREQRISRMVSGFSSGYGVSAKMLEDFLGHSLDTCTADEFMSLVGVFNALESGEQRASDIFQKKENHEATSPLEERIAKAQRVEELEALKPAVAGFDQPARKQLTAQIAARVKELKGAKPVEKQEVANEPVVPSPPPAAAPAVEPKAGPPVDAEKKDLDQLFGDTPL